MTIFDFIREQLVYVFNLMRDTEPFPWISLSVFDFLVGGGMLAIFLAFFNFHDDEEDD